MKLIGALFAFLALATVASGMALSDGVEHHKTQKPFKVEFNIWLSDSEPSNKVLVEVHPEWAPLGAARFRKLVHGGFYNDIKFFRVIRGFMAQFGVNGNPRKANMWRKERLEDDPVKVSNKRGYLTYASAGPNSRTTQMFFNTGTKNKFLDKQGFAPFAEVLKGMDVIDRINHRHGEEPDQSMMMQSGNLYLDSEFRDLSTIISAKIVH